MKVLIATPAYGGKVFRGFHESVTQTVLAFGRQFPFVAFEHRLIDVPVLATARNILASLVLADESFTHLLFVDADMAFSPKLIARMLAFRKPVVGSIYPEKKIDFDVLRVAMKQTQRTSLQALLTSAPYVCGAEVVWGEAADGVTELEVRDGFVRTRLSGTGVMLIEREVLVRIRDAMPDLWIAEPAAQIRAWGLAEGGLLQCFDSVVNSVGYFVSEDIAFCLRWGELGGEIWAAVDEAIVHSGSARYYGRFDVRLKASNNLVIKERSRHGGGADWFRARLKAGGAA
ncbi:hypothetical protein EYW49_20225 [Siculibacillus lacustris]|uniref:Uncharacterized protein n=1 Tax=Siculibacillus lacustris TaxID=1549641 RepID=A0A4Q9VF56_9HYPH|nr:hypothetical protein [Siculibacillus lacustris]TBW33505.1 hypothetical protein EYW49_20225 [Siculibacillus lacustris]